MGNYWTRTDAERAAYELGRIARMEQTHLIECPPDLKDLAELTAWIDGYHDEDELLTEFAA